MEYTPYAVHVWCMCVRVGCVGDQFVCFNFQPAMWDVMDGGIAGNDGGAVLFLIYFLKLFWLAS